MPLARRDHPPPPGPGRQRVRAWRHMCMPPAAGRGSASGGESRSRRDEHAPCRSRRREAILARGARLRRGRRSAEGPPLAAHHDLCAPSCESRSRRDEHAPLRPPCRSRDATPLPPRSFPGEGDRDLKRRGRSGWRRKVPPPRAPPASRYQPVGFKLATASDGAAAQLKPARLQHAGKGPRGLFRVKLWGSLSGPSAGPSALEPQNEMTHWQLLSSSSPVT